MKKIFILILGVLAFSSCSSDDNQNQNPVVGTWKLIKGETLVPGEGGAGKATTDYSDKNITYTFDRKGNLNINSNGSIETFMYEYKIDYLSNFQTTGETKTSIVFIDGSKWTYAVIDGKMVLGKSYVDGEDLFFEKQ